MRRALPALFALAAFSLALPPAAHATSAVSVSCGDTITTDTKLANDLTDCPGDGIVIGADNITLDLNGHTIDGDGVSSSFEEACPGGGSCDFDLGVDNSGGHDKVTIKGGSIRDFYDGVQMLGASDGRVSNLTLSNNLHVGVAVLDSANIQVDGNSSSASAAGILVAVSRDIRVERNSLARHGAGIAVNRSNHVRIVRNTASGNEAGVEISDQSDHNSIEGNFLSSNSFAGVVADADDTRVNRNRAFNNGDGIIIFGSRNSVTGNQIVDAVGCPDGCGFGISLEGGAGNLIERNVVYRTSADAIRIAAFEPDVPTADTVVRHNRVLNATGDGFSVATEGDGTLSGTLIERNVATGSGDDGFDIRSAATKLTSNVALRNGDLGIEAVPGVTDGGGNRATGNGNPAQCTGVACAS